ncbi:MAG: response regulator [Proteobacteria bacterium]|nr:response regulator [Pseudomonadota bacterium]
MTTRFSILLVDDDLHVLKSVARILGRQGWQVETVNSAAAAFERLAAQDFYVVISDLRMPDVDGIEFLSVVARRYPKTLQVLLSGSADAEQRQRAIDECDIRYFLGKPWDVEELKSVTDRLLHEAEYMRMSL